VRARVVRTADAGGRDVKLIAGLGNPGARYARTRHNVGFLVVERFAAPHSPSWSNRWDSRVARVRAGGEDLLLQQPQTFMNLSGTAVRRAA